MLRFIFAVAIACIATSALAQDAGKSLTGGAPGAISEGAWVQTGALVAANLSFSCGKGFVVISFRDGSVKLDHCTRNEGALAFWAAVHAMYPGNLRQK